MHEENLKKKTIAGFAWRFLERCGAQGVTFVVSIILARLLDPAVYGTIALVTVFTAVLQVFVDSGLGNALIQKKDSDQIDFSTVFYFNILMCLVVYGLLFLIAPLIAKFYGIPELIPIVRVLSLTVVISGVKNVQQAYVFKNMLYRKFFFSTVGGTIGAAIIGVTFAYAGFGVWALVCQQLFNLLLDTIILWITVKWRPSLVFSSKRLKGLFSFGWKLMISSFIHTLYNNLRTLIIGKVYTTADLAYYNKGHSFPNLVVTNINASVDSVLFPAMSSKQDDVNTVKNITRRAISISSYIMWPMLMGMAAVAEPLIRLLLTDKWLPAVPYLRLICITLAFEPMQTANLNAIKAMGRSELYLKMEIIKKTSSIGILLLSMKFGVIAITIGGAIYAFLATIINSWPNAKLLKYNYIDQIKDILPAVMLSLLMATLVYLIGLLPIPTLVGLILQVVSGVAIYIGVSHVAKMQPYVYLKDTAHKLLKRR